MSLLLSRVEFILFHYVLNIINLFLFSKFNL